MNLELVILEGPEAGRRIPVPVAPTTLGRAPAAAMAFPDDGFISSVHLSMQSEGEGVRITDLRSTNGTFLNDERVTFALAEVGDTIQIGTMRMQVARMRPAAPVQPVGYSAPVASAALRFEPPVANELPRMEVPAPPPFVPGIAATTTIPRILIDGAETFRRNDAKKPEAQSLSGALRDQLGSVSVPFFLMVNAAADESITARLAMADIDLAKHSLWKEDASSAPARWAPYLVPISVGAPLFSVLVDSGWGKGWLSLLASSAAVDDLIAHFRKFLKVQMDGTGGIYFRFYDPQVLREFLSSGSAAEVEMFFGPVTEWFLEGETGSGLVHALHGADGLRVKKLALPEAQA